MIIYVIWKDTFLLFLQDLLALIHLLLYFCMRVISPDLSSTCFKQPLGLISINNQQSTKVLSFHFFKILFFFLIYCLPCFYLFYDNAPLQKHIFIIYSLIYFFLIIVNLKTADRWARLLHGWVVIHSPRPRWVERG